MQDDKFQALLKKNDLALKDYKAGAQDYAFSKFSRVQLNKLREVLYRDKDCISYSGFDGHYHDFGDCLRLCFNHGNPPKNNPIFREMDDFLKYLEFYRLYKQKPPSSFRQFLKDHLALENRGSRYSWEELLDFSPILGLAFLIEFSGHPPDAFDHDLYSYSFGGLAVRRRMLWARSMLWYASMLPLVLVLVAPVLILGPLIVFICSVGAYFLAQKRSSESSKKLDDAYYQLGAVLNSDRGAMVILAQLFYPKQQAEEMPSLGGMPRDVLDCMVGKICGDKKAAKIAAVDVFSRIGERRGFNRKNDEMLPRSLCETSQVATSQTATDQVATLATNAP